MRDLPTPVRSSTLDSIGETSLDSGEKAWNLAVLEKFSKFSYTRAQWAVSVSLGWIKIDYGSGEGSSWKKTVSKVEDDWGTPVKMVNIWEMPEVFLIISANVSTVCWMKNLKYN